MRIAGNSNIDVLVPFDAFKKALLQGEVACDFHRDVVLHEPVILEIELPEIGSPLRWGIQGTLRAGDRLASKDFLGKAVRLPQGVAQLCGGGGGLNSAIAARLLHPSEEIELVIPLGNGDISQWLANYLEKYSIEVIPMSLEGEPPVNLVIEGVGPACDRIIVKGPRPKVRNETEIEFSTDDLILVQTVYSDDLAIKALKALINGAPGGIVATKALCRAASGRDGIDLRSWIRENVIPSLEDKHFVQMDEVEIEHLTGVKVRFPEDPNLLTAVSLLETRAVVLVTFGAAGGIAWSSGKVTRWYAAPGHPRRKVAAGDTLAAEFALEFHKTRALEEALKSAVAAADLMVLEGLDALSPQNLTKARSRVILEPAPEPFAVSKTKERG